MNELIDEAYQNYLDNFIEPICPETYDVQPDFYLPMNRKWFEKSILENHPRANGFTKQWGVTVERKEFTTLERFKWLVKTSNTNSWVLPWDRMAIPPHEWFNNYTKVYNTDIDIYVPKFSIMITYKGKTIEKYE